MRITNIFVRGADRVSRAGFYSGFPAPGVHLEITRPQFLTRSILLSLFEVHGATYGNLGKRWNEWLRGMQFDGEKKILVLMHKLGKLVGYVCFTEPRTDSTGKHWSKITESGVHSSGDRNTTLYVPLMNYTVHYIITQRATPVCEVPEGYSKLFRVAEVLGAEPIQDEAIIRRLFSDVFVDRRGIDLVRADDGRLLVSRRLNFSGENTKTCLYTMPDVVTGPALMDDAYPVIPNLE